ncbi:hypothetical protein JHW43_005925 [Diplocarpon mali]|nr:hypothetical protein JHW43_005925 [Diplocarpon mali]
MEKDKMETKQKPDKEKDKRGSATQPEAREPFTLDSSPVHLIRGGARPPPTRSHTPSTTHQRPRGRRGSPHESGRGRGVVALSPRRHPELCGVSRSTGCKSRTLPIGSCDREVPVASHRRHHDPPPPEHILYPSPKPLSSLPFSAVLLPAPLSVVHCPDAPGQRAKTKQEALSRVVEYGINCVSGTATALGVREPGARSSCRGSPSPSMRCVLWTLARKRAARMIHAPDMQNRRRAPWIITTSNRGSAEIRGVSLLAREGRRRGRLRRVSRARVCMTRNSCEATAAAGHRPPARDLRFEMTPIARTRLVASRRCGLHVAGGTHARGSREPPRPFLCPPLSTGRPHPPECQGGGGGGGGGTDDVRCSRARAEGGGDRSPAMRTAEMACDDFVADGSAARDDGTAAPGGHSSSVLGRVLLGERRGDADLLTLPLPLEQKGMALAGAALTGSRCDGAPLGDERPRATGHGHGHGHGGPPASTADDFWTFLRNASFGIPLAPPSSVLWLAVQHFDTAACPPTGGAAVRSADHGPGVQGLVGVARHPAPPAEGGALGFSSSWSLTRIGHSCTGCPTRDSIGRRRDVLFSCRHVEAFLLAEASHGPDALGPLPPATNPSVLAHPEGGRGEKLDIHLLESGRRRPNDHCSSRCAQGSGKSKRQGKRGAEETNPNTERRVARPSIESRHHGGRRELTGETTEAESENESSAPPFSRGRDCTRLAPRRRSGRRRAKILHDHTCARWIPRGGSTSRATSESWELGAVESRVHSTSTESLPILSTRSASQSRGIYFGPHGHQLSIAACPIWGGSSSRLQYSAVQCSSRQSVVGVGPPGIPECFRNPEGFSCDSRHLWPMLSRLRAHVSACRCAGGDGTIQRWQQSVAWRASGRLGSNGAHVVPGGLTDQPTMLGTRAHTPPAGQGPAAAEERTKRFSSSVSTGGCERSGSRLLCLRGDASEAVLVFCVYGGMRAKRPLAHPAREYWGVVS